MKLMDFWQKQPLKMQFQGMHANMYSRTGNMTSTLTRSVNITS